MRPRRKGAVVPFVLRGLAPVARRYAVCAMCGYEWVETDGSKRLFHYGCSVGEGVLR